MSKLIATRGVQYPLTATFEFDIAAGDEMLDINAALKTLAAGGAFDVINQPGSAVVIGGDVTVETASNDTGTATIAVGDAGSATRYLAATSIKAAARTPLVPTGYNNTAGDNIRVTVANANGDATAGKVRLTVQYIILGRAHEVQTV